MIKQIQKIKIITNISAKERSLVLEMIGSVSRHDTVEIINRIKAAPSWPTLKIDDYDLPVVQLGMKT